MKIIKVAVILFVGFSFACKKKGCTDETATNYSEEAEKDDGTCTYSEETTFTLTSEAIVDGELLDAFKCETSVYGVENSIPLAWSNVPDGTGSLAIIMEHFPNPDDLTMGNSYLLLWNIDPSVTEIPYATADDGPWYMGSNKDGTNISYTSPCSPDPVTHAYSIKLYALNETPASLPTENSLTVDWSTMNDAISSVTVVGTAVLDFNDVN